MPSERDVLKISVRMGAISLWSSLRIRGEILSGPTAFPGLNLRSCLDTPESDIVMSCMDGELSVCLCSTQRKLELYELMSDFTHGRQVPKTNARQFVKNSNFETSFFLSFFRMYFPSVQKHLLR